MAEKRHDCGVLELLKLFGKKWTYGLFHNLSDTPLSFNDIDKMSNREINPSLLANRLKGFVELNLVKREKANTRVLYSLTDKGNRLRDNLKTIKLLTDELECFIPEECIGQDCAGCKGFNRYKEEE